MKTLLLILSTFNFVALSAKADLQIASRYTDTDLVSCAVDTQSGRSFAIYFDIDNFFKRNIHYLLVGRDCRQFFRPGLGMMRPKLLENTDQPEIDGIAVSPALRDNFRCIHYGARRCGDEFKQGYRSLGPTEEYTHELNKKLSRLYGAQFSARTYTRWMIEQRGSLPAIRKILQYVNSPEKKAFYISPRHDGGSRPLTVMVSHGLGWDPDHLDAPDKMAVKAMIEQIQGNVVNFRREIYNSLLNNGVVIRSQLDQVLDSGSDVVILSLSKGVADVMSALNLPPAPTRVTKEKRGKVIGFINLSGLARGTRFGNLAEDVDGGLARSLIDLFTSDPESYKQMLRILKALTPDKLAPIAEQFVKLPVVKESVVIEFAGVPRRYGLMPIERGTMINIFKRIRQFSLVEGASDGIIEHPNQTLPKIEGGVQYQIPMDGTHVPLDGFVYSNPETGKVGMDLFEKSIQLKLLPAILQFLVDEYREHFNK